MAKPAARMSDMHTCPMEENKRKHQGGPILEGSPDVFINGLPAARVGDQLKCDGSPDTIVEGEPSILIDGRPIARMRDHTAHGGIIIGGSGDVIIGDSRQNTLQSNITSDFGLFDEQFHLVGMDGETPLKNCRYRITDSNGQIWEGISDTDGLTERVYTYTAVELSIEICQENNIEEIV